MNSRPILPPPPSGQRKMDFAADMLGGKQYTNFEKKPRKKREPSKWEEVVAAPADLKTFEVKIDPEKIYYFHGRKNWLSTFYRAPMNIEGHIYPSVEHYYQACKLYMLGGAQMSNRIRRVRDPGETKQVARRLLNQVVTPEQIDEWKMVHGPMILQHALIHKFVQHANLRKKLLELDGQLLVHAYDQDRVYGAGMNQEKFEEWAKENKDKSFKVPNTATGETLHYYPLIGNGKNVLGVLLMRVRDDIKKFQAAVPENTNEESATGQILAAAMSALELGGGLPVNLKKKNEEEEENRKKKREEREAKEKEAIDALLANKDNPTS